MDKQKQIEEMAKHGCYDGCASGLRKFCDEYDGKPCKNMVRIASGLYEQGYRKIPENGVVVSEQVWDEHILNWDKASKALKEQTRKETAEKFAERLKKVIHERDYVEGYAYLGICEEIDEICKEITEGENETI